MPDLAVEYLPLADLVPYARNARTHSPAQVAQLVASIREFGWTNPVLIDEAGGIIAGHGRVMAAQQMGMDQVPCIRLAHLTDTQRRAYVLADNRLALNAGWDEELLAAELQALDVDGYDMGLTGFGSAEIDRLLAGLEPALDPDTEADREDATPPIRPQAITQPGDLWLLGDHRLLCGDSTEAADVARLVSGRRAALMATDPPYGVSHVATKHGIPRSGFQDMEDRWEHIANDGLQDKALQDFLERVFRAAVGHALTDNAAWYLWHAHLTQGFFAAAAAAAADVLLHRQIIWVKPSMVLTRSGMYHWRHEPCFYGWRRGHMPPWYGDKSQTSVWAVGRDRDTVHPTQKPVALWAAPIANHTRRGECIYEPFAGSGSQLIAAEKAARTCLAIELSPHYCDAIVRRWQDYAGRAATLDGDGRTFAQIEAARTPATA
jgi:DNA modification methylase